MDIEIELKYLLTGENNAEKISALFTDKNISFQYSEKELNNCYFDTPDLALRQADIGLRVRTSSAGLIEQTIKTSGNVLAGLHQRPEYNVNIEGNFPELALFPNEIWSRQEDVAALQNQLVSLFSTNFHRQNWVVSFENGDIVELAYDLGTISSEGNQVEINELELELLKGDPARLLSLARLLSEHLAMRPGTLSKAARGYALANGTTPKITVDDIYLIPLSSDETVNQSLVTGLQYGLGQLLASVDDFLLEPKLEKLRKVTDALALIRHGLWLYKGYIPESNSEAIRENLKYFLKNLAWVEPAKQLKELTAKTGNYRKKIEYSQSLIEQLKIEKKRFPEMSEIVPLFYSSQFNQLQLDIFSLIFHENKDIKRQAMHDSEQGQFSLYRFANKWLENSLDEVVQAMPKSKQMTVKDYIKEHRLLIRSLLTGSWFGHLYESHERYEFRGPWVDIQQGMDELETLWVLKQQLESLDDASSDKLVNWLESKVDGLLKAMDYSRQMALGLNPYWG